jgi:hypothetical protein
MEEDDLVSEPSPPAPEALAQQAMALARTALEQLRKFGSQAHPDAYHEAFVLLLDELHSAPRRPITDETWVRHAAQQLLVALSSDRQASDESGDSGDPEDSYEPISDRIDKAWRLLAAERLDDAAHVASLALADVAEAEHPEDLGNEVHHGNLILGHVRIRQDDVAAAGDHLIAAGETPGSPQLDSFGPNMSLAAALLKAGQAKTVLRYFDKCATFWDERFSQLPQWRAYVRAGEVPTFGANLRYGIPDESEGT